MHCSAGAPPSPLDSRRAWLAAARGVCGALGQCVDVRQVGPRVLARRVLS